LTRAGGRIGARGGGDRRMTVSTVSDNQHEIIRNIIHLYCPNGIFLDPTYSTGKFYGEKVGIPKPVLCFDINPQHKECLQGDARSLPIDTGSIESVMFDPPFIGASRKDGKPGIIKTRFSYYKNIPELWKFYNEALIEIYRILSPRGILVFKCQDSVECSKQWWSHVAIHNMALELGFIAEDLFILVAKSRLMRENWTQQHARKFHSYFWVFRKGNR
jgi:hypothetical protein